jgi:hypothetical protein
MRSAVVILSGQYQPGIMSEGAVAPLPASETSRHRGGQQPFVPTQAQREAVAIMAALGASHPTMIEILGRNGVICKDRKTLRKVFHEELKQGKENLITTLGLRMVHLATTDGPHSFQACAFLLARLGGPPWRLPKDGDGDVRDGGGERNVRIYLPANGREDISPETVVPPIIDGEAEPSPGG